MQPGDLVMSNRSGRAMTSTRMYDNVNLRATFDIRWFSFGIVISRVHPDEAYGARVLVLDSGTSQYGWLPEKCVHPL